MISAGPDGPPTAERAATCRRPVAISFADGRILAHVHLHHREESRSSGSAKGASGWMSVSDSSVYLDHPVHAPFGHTLNIDFLAPELGPSGRVAVELSQDSARTLAKAIQAVLDAAPPGLD